MGTEFGWVYKCGHLGVRHWRGRPAACRNHGLRNHHAQQHPSFNKEIKQRLPVILQFVVARVCLHGGGDGAPPPPANSKVLKAGYAINIREKVVALDCREVWCEAKVVDMRHMKSDRSKISQVSFAAPPHLRGAPRRPVPQPAAAPSSPCR